MSLSYKLCKTNKTLNGVALFRVKIKDGLFYRNGPLVSGNVKLDLCEKSSIDENSVIFCNDKICDFLFKLENSIITNTTICVNFIPDDFRYDSWGMDLYSTKITDSKIDCFSLRANKSKIDRLTATCEEIKFNDSVISDVDMAGTLNDLDSVHCNNTKIKNGVLTSALKDFYMFCRNSDIENSYIIGSTIEKSTIKHCSIESSRIINCTLLNPLKLNSVRFYDIKDMFYLWSDIEKESPFILSFVSGADFPAIKSLTLKGTDTFCFIFSRRTFCCVYRDSDSGLISRIYETNRGEEYDTFSGYFFGETQEDVLNFSKKYFDKNDFDILSTFAQFDDAYFDNNVDFALMFFACCEDLEVLKKKFSEGLLFDIYNSKIKKDEEKLNMIKKERMCFNGES